MPDTALYSISSKNKAMVASELVDVFLHKMPTSLLLTIKQFERTYISVLAKECNCTYPHAVKTLWGMERLGLLKSQKVGRVKYVELTDHGKLVAEALNELVNDLEASDAPLKNEFDHINQKINKVIQKVETIKKEVETGTSISRDEAIRFNRRLGPYYRELNAIQFMSNIQPNNPLRSKATEIARTLGQIKKEIRERDEGQ